jgi:hypothetical protein
MLGGQGDFSSDLSKCATLRPLCLKWYVPKTPSSFFNSSQKRITSIASLSVKNVAMTPLLQHITRDVEQICSWNLTSNFSERSFFLCPNRPSKPKTQAIFTIFYCNIKQLPWSGPNQQTIVYLGKVRDAEAMRWVENLYA